MPESGSYREIINTGGETYGGSNVGNLGGVHSERELLQSVGLLLMKEAFE